MARDLVKTTTFAVLHFGTAFGIGYALTGSLKVATGIALIEPFANTVVFFFHEQVWRRIAQPRKPAAEGRALLAGPDGAALC